MLKLLLVHLAELSRAKSHIYLVAEEDYLVVLNIL